jgi:hypothetical protein
VLARAGQCSGSHVARQQRLAARQMALPGPLGLARRLAGSASFRVAALTSLGLLGAWLAQSTGAAQDLEPHKFGEVRAVVRGLGYGRVGWWACWAPGSRSPRGPRGTWICTRLATCARRPGTATARAAPAAPQARCLMPAGRGR